MDYYFSSEISTNLDSKATVLHSNVGILSVGTNRRGSKRWCPNSTSCTSTHTLRTINRTLSAVSGCPGLFLNVFITESEVMEFSYSEGTRPEKLGQHPKVHLTFAIRILRYSIGYDHQDELCQMTQSLLGESLEAFSDEFIKFFEDEYLRILTEAHLKRMLSINAARGFPE